LVLETIVLPLELFSFCLRDHNEDLFFIKPRLTVPLFG
jgi:hypothetical protein